MICHHGYKSWETGLQARFVTIVIINTEPKKSIFMSKTLCCVIISSGPKEWPVLGQDTLLHKVSVKQEQKMFTSSFKGPWAPCLSFNSFMTLTVHCEFDLISIREAVT